MNKQMWQFHASRHNIKYQYGLRYQYLNGSKVREVWASLGTSLGILEMFCDVTDMNQYFDRALPSSLMTSMWHFNLCSWIRCFYMSRLSTLVSSTIIYFTFAQSGFLIRLKLQLHQMVHRDWLNILNLITRLLWKFKSCNQSISWYVYCPKRKIIRPLHSQYN